MKANKPVIREIIVVEGYSDLRAVKAAVDAEVIVTSGFMISAETYEKIRNANERRGVIILTDPDKAGEDIRKKISSKIKGVKHGFLTRDEAKKDGDVGIENASPSSIIEALSKVRQISDEPKRIEFTNGDLLKWNLIGCHKASDNRAFAGKELGIGYANGKQFLNRLNGYGISREEFEETVRKLNGS